MDKKELIIIVILIVGSLVVITTHLPSKRQTCTTGYCYPVD